MTTINPESSADNLLDDLLAEISRLQKGGRAFTRSCPVRLQEVASPVPKPKPRRSPRHYGGPVTVTLGLALIAAAAYVAFHYVTTSIHLQRARAALQSAKTDLDIVKTNLKNADLFRRKKDFRQAFQAYDRALFTCRDVMSRLNEHTRRLTPGPEKTEADAITAESSALIKKARDALAAPEINYAGKHGLVLFDGEWMTPRKQKELFEKRMEAEGKVFYEGKWRTHAEVADMRGLIFYNERYITKEEYRKIQAAKRKPTPKPPAVAKKPEPRPRVRRPRIPPTTFNPAARRWVLDDFEKGNVWRAVNWKNANPCKLNIIEGSESKRLKMKLLGGDQPKSAIVRQLRLDFSSRSRLVMDVENNCKENVPIAIAIQTDNYYESRTKMLKPGMNKRVTFNLKSGDFKCQATGWAHAKKITRPQSAMWLHLLVYYTQPGENIIDNIVIQGNGS